jgi:hypothetical protein
MTDRNMPEALTRELGDEAFDRDDDVVFEQTT